MKIHLYVLIQWQDFQALICIYFRISLIKHISKWFTKKIGNEGVFKMVDGFEDKTGYAICIIALMDKGMKEPQVFVGKTNVNIHYLFLR